LRVVDDAKAVLLQRFEATAPAVRVGGKLDDLKLLRELKDARLYLGDINAPMGIINRALEGEERLEMPIERASYGDAAIPIVGTVKRYDDLLAGLKPPIRLKALKRARR
jgi:hypothetical protein